jgi:hypothetical protein
LELGLTVEVGVTVEEGVTVDEGLTVDETVEVGVAGTEPYRSTGGGVGAVTPAVPTVRLKAAAHDPSR